MKILLKRATIVYPGHALNGKKRDILIEKGVITSIGNSLNPEGNFKEIKSKNLHVSPGWLDLRANFCEPGFEERETLESGSKAAAYGGFTGVCITPNTLPIVDTRSSIEFIKSRSQHQAVELFPLGALSRETKGRDLSEMYDMQQAGAVAFTDGQKGIQNAKFMQLALQYAHGIDALVMSFPMENELKGKAQVNEGDNSTQLGLKGIPNIAEELMVSRDLYLQDYAESRLHFTTLSSAKSVDLVSKAKKAGQNVSCDVSAIQLVLNDSVLAEFDSNHKVMPPLRSEKDRKGLIKHLKANNIDVVCSNHTPHNIENKNCEFELADYGITAIQTVYPLLNGLVNEGLTQETIIEKIAVNPRKIIRQELPNIEEGATANLTIFDPNIEWEYNEKTNVSKSVNSPFIGTKLTGKVVGIINRKQLVLTD
ncbi:MAG: dihydroorotase [Salibacteraceae bacterium]